MTHSTRGPSRPSRRAVGAFALAVLLLGLVVGAAPPKLRTMPTSEIRAGMRGYGLTVLRGTEPERFDIEVIDVLHNFRADQDLVLIRTPHPILEHTGSVAGMSGSPIFIDERMVGAYAYGWQFGKDAIAGVTAISNMLAEMWRPLRPSNFLFSPVPAGAPSTKQAAREVSDPYNGERRDAFHALSKHAARIVTPTSGLVPAATPLLVSGMTPRVTEMLNEKLGPLGLTVLESGGASGSSEAADGPSGFVNGGSIAVQLLRGNIQATAVGTVTYVDGERVLAFGHPMLDAGEIALPTATSRVLHVLASQRSSFKMAEAIKPLGALVHDRQSAIVIDTKVKAKTVPVVIRIKNVPGLPRSEWRVETVNHRLLTPALVLSAVASALGASLNDHTPMRFRAKTNISLAKHGTHTLMDEAYSASGVSQVGALSRLKMFDVLEAAYGNSFEEVIPERVEIEFEPVFGRQVTELLGAQLVASELDPGESARLVLTLRPFDGGIEQRVVEVPLSASFAGESIDLEVTPGDAVTLERPVPRSFDDLLTAIKQGYPSTSLVISVQRKGRGMSFGGNVVPNLPNSAIDALATINDTGRGPIFITQSRTLMPMDRVMTGRAKLTVDIRKEKQ